MDLFECIIKTKKNLFYSIKNKELKKYNFHYESKIANNLYSCLEIINNNNNKIVFLNTLYNIAFKSEKYDLKKRCKKQVVETFPTMITTCKCDLSDICRFSNNIYDDNMYYIELLNSTNYIINSATNLKYHDIDETFINPCITMKLTHRCYSSTDVEIVYMHAPQKYYIINLNTYEKSNSIIIEKCTIINDNITETYKIRDHAIRIYSDDFIGYDDDRTVKNTIKKFHIASFYNTFVCYYANQVGSDCSIIYVVNTCTDKVRKIVIVACIKNIKILSVDSDMIYIYIVKTKEIKRYSLLTSENDYSIKLDEEIDYICELNTTTFLLITKKLTRENKTFITFKRLEIYGPAIINTGKTYEITLLSNTIIDNNLMDSEFIVNISKLSYQKYKNKHITDKICVHDDIWTTIFKNFF